ncbi:MAG: hypothetical protein AAB437_01255 [Patescibacteria group bacterium]
MKKIKLDKIPYLFKNINLPYEVFISNKIAPIEGSIIVVKALENEGKKDDFDFANGRLGKVVKGDIFPGILGSRKAVVEFAGYIPSNVDIGNELYLVCESGLIGQISGVYESWGKPMKVKVLGSIVDKDRNQLNLKNYSLPKIKNNKNILIIAFIGTRMDCGKTTMACKIALGLKNAGKKIVAIKPTGVAFSQDLYKLKEYGAFEVLDFVDMGLPSTCNGNHKEIISSTENLINHAKSFEPDFILMEFGDSLLGAYHVKDILNYLPIKQQIKFLILAANDLLGVEGAKTILKKYQLKIDLVTGPIANSEIGIDLIKKNFQLEAESNQHKIPKTINMIMNLLKVKNKSYES